MLAPAPTCSRLDPDWAVVLALAAALSLGLGGAARGEGHGAVEGHGGGEGHAAHEGHHGHPAEKHEAEAPHDQVGEGDHWRIETETGPVHVWRPNHYDRHSAGIVVYVHGLYTHVDEAWQDHKLAQQFEESRQNALFIAPEAPNASEEETQFPSLGLLLAAVWEGTKIRPPHGPMIVVGHSGAYRTILGWLDYPGHPARPAIDHVFLVDALYGNEEEYAGWLARGHRMTLIDRGTSKWCEPFVARFPDAQSRSQIPDDLDELSPEERSARLLYLKSQYGHMELITDCRVLPVLLHRTRLKLVREPSGGHARRGEKTAREASAEPTSRPR